MDPNKFNDELWHEIPGNVYVALGRRGRDTIDLHQCFIPSCDNKNDENIHPISKSEEIVKKGNKNPITLKKYLMYCSHGDHHFELVFEQHHEKLEGNTNKNDKFVFERVYAQDPQTNENFGEIGYVQTR